MNLFLAGILAGFSIALLTTVAARWLAHLSAQPAPTKYRRRYRDAPIPEVQPPWEREEEDRVRYQFMGVTGSEE